MTRNNAPIENHAIKDAVDAGIQYALKFSEFSACVAAGLNLERWINSGYPSEFKADVIAWWQLRSEVAIHQQDAKNRKEARMMKKKRR